MITWLPWSADAFARAAREGKPVLLSITAAWCHACHEMDRTTYADPEVAALVRDRFIAVRVDTDRRPDINERYNLGGWPTSAFAPGLGSAGPDPVKPSASVLSFGETAPSALDVEVLTESIFSTFDDEHG